MGEACRKFETPVTGGNVSFYNQNPEGPVYPTPTIGMVGLLENLENRMTLDFKETGDVIYLIGETRNDINSSQYLSKICGIEFSPAPHFVLDEEFELHKKIAELISKGVIESAHDVSEGGLFITLCESGFNNELGFAVETKDGIRKDAYLFGEAQSRVVVTVNPSSIELFEKTIADFPHERLGIVTSGEMLIDEDFWGTIDWWKEEYDTAIEKYLAKEEAGAALSSI
jgi:phosphoribosylformylglycinamidine synthase